jgi:leader peptidase (prepilin peptidase)/N-methyltransferase
VLLLASLGGSVVGIGLILIKGHSRSAAMPFGPFLASAGFIMLIWGPSLLQTYARLLGV